MTTYRFAGPFEHVRGPVTYDIQYADEPHDTPDAPASDPINPAHYKVGGAEVIDIVEHLPYNAGNAVKYLARAGRKDPAKHVEDLKKALWYTQRELDRIQGDTRG